MALPKNDKGKILISKEKSPFEKVKSATEARRIFDRLPRDAKEFYCKGEGELFSFIPETFDGVAALTGRLVSFEPSEFVAESVVVNFIVADERYYTTCDFVPQGEFGVLKFSSPLYRLERRGHYRVTLPSTLERACNIIQQDGRAVFVSAVVLDISQGGARLQILKGKVKDLKPGVRARCAFHIKSKWTFEIMAQIMHISDGDGSDVFGVQFQNISDSETRKLLSMMLELQREVLRVQT